MGPPLLGLWGLHTHPQEQLWGSASQCLPLHCCRVQARRKLGTATDWHLSPQVTQVARLPHAHEPQFCNVLLTTAYLPGGKLGQAHARLQPCPPSHASPHCFHQLLGDSGGDHWWARSRQRKPRRRETGYPGVTCTQGGECGHLPSPRPSASLPRSPSSSAALVLVPVDKLSRLARKTRTLQTKAPRTQANQSTKSTAMAKDPLQ